MIIKMKIPVPVVQPESAIAEKRSYAPGGGDPNFPIR